MGADATREDGNPLSILMFYPGWLHTLPPLLAASAGLAAAGAKVTVVAFGAEDDTTEYARRHNVALIFVGRRPATTVVGKARLWLRAMLRFQWEQLRTRPDCVWEHQVGSISWHAFLPHVARNAVYLLHSHELSTHWWPAWVTEKLLARRAHVVITPEDNRGHILRHFSRSKGVFRVIPNRVLDDMVGSIPSASAGTRQALTAFREHGGAAECTRFLIYQGAVHGYRCLEEMVRAFKAVPFGDAGLIILGGDPDSQVCRALMSLAQQDRRIVFLPRIPFPRHLEITAGCVGGVLLYSPTLLNNVYCAPNKVYEYASFGLGMVLPNYPGMVGLCDKFGLGAVCDPVDVGSITAAMVSVLSAEPGTYPDACRRFLATTRSTEEAYQDLHAELKSLVGARRSV